VNPVIVQSLVEQKGKPMPLILRRPTPSIAALREKLFCTK
jgi:hypothetical protein